MNGVEFNDQSTQNLSSQNYRTEKKASWMVKFLIDKQLVEDEGGANKVLLGITLAIFVLAIITYVLLSPPAVEIPKTTPEGIRMMIQNQPMNP